MSLRFLSLLVLAAAACDRTAYPDGREPVRELRVCADPNNLPFSNVEQQGFENRLAQLVARDLEADVRYTWWAQRRGFVRNTVGAGSCDVVMGVPSEYELLSTTRPYYRSSYVFLSRADRALSLSSLDDPALRKVRIGVHVIGDDYANPPPAHGLARRRIVNNVVGYSIFGDYRQPNPPARLVRAVIDQEVDVAILWGPLAGFFAGRQPLPMSVTPVSEDPQLPGVPFAFDIAVGVSRDRRDLRMQIDEVLARRAADIDRLLDDFDVPHTRPGEGGTR